jgi:hypothetical protein
MNREQIAKEIEKVYLSSPRMKEINDIADWHIAEIEKAKQETLDFISYSEGWEESRDNYATKLGLPTRYLSEVKDNE